MAEAILKGALQGKIPESELVSWLCPTDNTKSKFEENNCSRTTFITYFLNYLHETLENSLNTNGEPQAAPIKLHSCESTPERAPLLYHPTSPLYEPTLNKKTPQKSPLVLGDFIVINRRSSSSKKKGAKTSEGAPRRIKPTNLAQQRMGVQNSENSFSFDNSAPELPGDRIDLLEERLKMSTRQDLAFATPLRKVAPKGPRCEVFPKMTLVTYRKQLDLIVRLYCSLLHGCYTVNLTGELIFLFGLLSKTQFGEPDSGIVAFDAVPDLFNSIHNVTYFTVQTLEKLINVLMLLDRSTRRILVENERVRAFSAQLTTVLDSGPVIVVTDTTPSQQDTVCFNSDTDNRRNFPNAPSFHAFRKQRDLFYDILRLWDQQRLDSGFNFAASFGGKIKTLLNLHPEPTNLVHFARLFKSQLLKTCRNLVSGLEMDAQKLSRLTSRCVTKENRDGINALPKFDEGEEFYRSFIIVGESHAFNRHLCDALAREITELNETSLDSPDNEVDNATKTSFHQTIKALRLLAKFLGFIEALPYQSEPTTYSKHLLELHLETREQTFPAFNVLNLLEKAIAHNTLILLMPWLTQYLSMLDYVTLRKIYYTKIINLLFNIYKNYDSIPDYNQYLLKFNLGWLFDLPHFPIEGYFNFCICQNDSTVTSNTKVTLDYLPIVDQTILYCCCPFLDEFKKILTTTSLHSLTVKHITPVTSIQSPEQIAQKKIEQQLEEAFFNGHPASLRKTVEFVSERVASSCVKLICSDVVPRHKKLGLVRLTSLLSGVISENVEERKLALKLKATQFSAVCLGELVGACHSDSAAICSEKIPQAVEALLAWDVLPQTKEVCVGITKRMCMERVTQWVGSHVTQVVFLKDFNEEVNRLSYFHKKVEKAAFVLPPGGGRSHHNEESTSAVHLIEKIMKSCVDFVEDRPVSESALYELVQEILKSTQERCDINQSILSTICSQLVDLTVLSITHSCVFPPMSTLCEIWKLYYKDGDFLFKSLLTPRNVVILRESSNPGKSWGIFARFCVDLVTNNMLTTECFESQCMGLFTRDWDEGTLKLITNFFRDFIRLYRDSGGNVSNFTLMIEFLSEFCEDL